MREGSGYQTLKAQTSIQDILSVAIQFEKTARDFYTDMIPKVSKRIRYLVEELAEEEQRHFDLLSDMVARSDITAALQQRIAVPPSDSKFSDCIQAPELSEQPDDQAILQYALRREQAAMEQYQDLANKSDKGPIKDLFQYLAHEETEHKLELEKLYYEVVHTGGV